MSQPYRTAPKRAGRCGRGHMHDAKAIGGYCCIPPCRGIGEGGWWDPERRIEAVVSEGTWPNAQSETPR